MPPTHRTFLAVDLADDVRRRLGTVRDALGEAGRPVRWVLPANLHVTLHFLGDVSASVLDDLSRRVVEIATGHPPFEMTVGPATTVPPRGRTVRMVWAAVADPTGGLARLHAALAGMLSGMDLPVERRVWRPHVTLGRVGSLRDPESFRRRLAGLEPIDEPQAVEWVTVYTSQLRRSGALYSAVARGRLGCS